MPAARPPRTTARLESLPRTLPRAAGVGQRTQRETYLEARRAHQSPAERGGDLLGYAYAHPFIGRAAYDWSAEMTIYLRMDARRAGIGGQLYRTLEDLLRDMGVLNLNACIGYPQTDDDPYLTTNSVDFHKHLGYEWVGRFHDTGSKFGRWYDMVWMEKLLAPHQTPPTPICPFPDLRSPKKDAVMEE